MQWDSIGFKANPFRTDPITSQVLDLYTGNEDKLAQCQFALKSEDIVIVIEGGRGVGTTSFANVLRFSLQQKKQYFTPRGEIGVEPNWNAETLIAAVMSHIVMELEHYHNSAVKDQEVFKTAKAFVSQIAETYHQMGVSAFGFGVNYGKSAGAVTQPVLIPTPILFHHLEKLIVLIKKIGFKQGILIQLNNLDIGTVQNEEHLQVLFNVMRDYFQTPGISWLLVGDVGLRKFIAQHVDRLDDIVAHEVAIESLSKKAYLGLINKRVEYYKVNKKVTLPVDEDVLLYLFAVTKGRLRYVFILLRRLFTLLQIGSLMTKVTLDLAKPLVMQFAQERVERFNLSDNERLILKLIVAHDTIQVKQLAALAKKKSNYVSSILSQLLNYKLVTYRKEGTNKFYFPAIDAHIAFLS